MRNRRAPLAVNFRGGLHEFPRATDVVSDTPTVDGKRTVKVSSGCRPSPPATRLGDASTSVADIVPAENDIVGFFSVQFDRLLKLNSGEYAGYDSIYGMIRCIFQLSRYGYICHVQAGSSKWVG